MPVLFFLLTEVTALRVLPPRFFRGRLGAILLISHAPLFAQFIPPSGGNPVAVACPKGPTTGTGINPLETWRTAKRIASIEGDGVFGIGNLGHTEEALEWYCKASAAGNAFAAYDIAEIFRDGYVVNSTGPGGHTVTKHYLADLPTAFYWYQLAAKRDFTRAMVALARYYALGDEILKGSPVHKDVGQAAIWLNRAADYGDTTALKMLALRHAGRETAPWGMALPLSPDRAKAQNAAALARGLLIRFSSECTNPSAVKDMVDNLPDVSEGRKVRGASLVEVHGSSTTRPMELDCLLSLSGPPPSQQNEPVIDQFYRLIHGGTVGAWGYSLIQLPGANESTMHRETGTQAVIQGVEEMALLLEIISPPSNSGAPTNPTREQKPNPLSTTRVGPKGWRRFDMNGVWEATYGTRGAAGFHVIDIKIEDDGDYITAELLSPPANASPEDIVLFAAIYDSGDIVATIPPTYTNGKPNYRQAMIHIVDADHFRIEGYPQFQRAKR
jgi:hypothetical protein